MSKKAREQMARHLGALSHEGLAELVTEMAAGDIELRNRLLLKTASQAPGLSMQRCTGTCSSMRCGRA